MIDFINYWNYQPVTQPVDLNCKFINGASFLALAKSMYYFSFSVIVSLAHLVVCTAISAWHLNKGFIITSITSIIKIIGIPQHFQANIEYTLKRFE